jgi:hypothetical protein
MRSLLTRCGGLKGGARRYDQFYTNP